MKSSDTLHLGVVLFDRFSMYGFANVLEPLRAANDFLGHRAWDWQIAAPGGTPVTSSSGVEILPDVAFEDLSRGDLLILLPSYDYQRHATPTMSRSLRRLARDWRIIAGLDAGSWLMAAAGLLDGRPATIHFDEFDHFSERFPEVNAQRVRRVRDGNRITTAGALPAYDLMLDLIAERHGTALSLQIGALFMQDQAPIAPSALNPGSDRLVRRALAEMEAALEDPVSINTLARRLNVSQRRLEQRFRTVLGAPPRQVYRRVRMNAAHRMASADGMSVAEIATRCGYADASAFARAFRTEFGIAPASLRD